MKTENVQCTHGAKGKGKKHKTEAPEGGLIKAGPNKWKDDRYEFEFSKGELLITDTTNGTTSRVHGDPHLWTGDGDKLGFHKENLTLDLKNGTKITLIPTEVNEKGVSLLDKVAIMTPNRGIVVGEISEGGLKVEERSKDTASIDDLYEDGNVLVAGDEVDDWFKQVLEEVTGTNNGGDHIVDGSGGESGITFETKGEKPSGTDASDGASDAEGPDAPTGKGVGGIIESIEQLIGEADLEIEDLTAEYKAADPDDKPLVLEKIKAAYAKRSMLFQLMSNISKTDNDTLLAITRNLRVG